MFKSKIMIIGIVSLLVLYVNLSASILPGVKMTISQNGLNYGQSVGLQYLQRKLTTTVINLPDISGSKDTIDYTVSSIQVAHITVPSLSVSIVPNVGINIGTASISAVITANWHGREKIWPHPSGSGDATIILSQTSASTTAQITVSIGRPHVTAVNTKAAIGSVDMHFSGSHLDFLLNLLKHVFENDVKNSAESGIANAINSEMDGALNQILATLPITSPVSTIAEIDYSLVSNALFTPTYLSIAAKGEFYNIAKPVEAPYTPTPLPDSSSSTGSSMAQIFLGEYVPNTGAWVYFRAGALVGTVTAAEVPPSSPIQLNTSSWQSLVPALYKKYPNWAMQLQIGASQAPYLDFTTAGIKGYAQGNIVFEVISPVNKSAIPAFTIHAVIAANAAVAIKGANITGQFTYFSANFSLLSSNIGPFDPSQLDSLLTFVIAGIVVPYVNSYLAVGFPIPAVDGLQFVNPSIAFNSGYITISTSLYYPPPS